MRVASSYMHDQYSAMSQSKVGSNYIVGGSGKRELKAGPTSTQGNEKVPRAAAGVAQAAQRGSIVSGAARVKVWEERIEEEEEERFQDQNELEEMESSLQTASSSCSNMSKLGIKGPSSGGASMQKQMRTQQGGTVDGAGSKRTTKTSASEEIGVFDAERYFGGGAADQLEQRAGSWTREEEDELMEGEAGGDLPLSPLVEFGWRWRWRPDGAGASNAGAGPASSSACGGGRRRVESIDQFTSPRTSTASSCTVSELEAAQQQQRSTTIAPSCTSSAHGVGSGKLLKNSKPQPASPSGRLANFLAKFKAPTPRKSPATACSSPINLPMSTTPPPPPAARIVRPSPSVLSPAKKLFPSYSLGGLAASSSSPRGRFLRAFSSSSADNAPTSAVCLRYNSNTSSTTTAPCIPAACTPVSPAARSAPPDPYSPVALSASTTATSSKFVRSSAGHSNYSHVQYGSRSSSTSSARSKVPDSGHCNSQASFKQQLPFLSRKLKVYLMPDKVADPAGKGIIKPPASKTAAQGGDDFRGVPVGHARSVQQVEGSASKQRRRWLHVEDQVVDEDIELAERLLRVVQDHQSSGMSCSQHSKFSLLSCQQATNNTNCTNSTSNNIRFSTNVNLKSLQHVDRVSEYSSRKYEQMHPATIRATSNLVPPATSAVHYSNGNSTSLNSSKAAAGPYPPAYLRSCINPAGYLQLPTSAAATKDEDASQQPIYDSDSSSDLFEIETTLGSSMGMGLYTRRDLPVYEAKEAAFPSLSVISTLITSATASARSAR